MATYTSAIERQQGKADTDNNGLARYSLKIETPDGVKSGNEPDLSLQYTQGTPNGIVGLSWVLGGVSSIYLGPPRVVYDNINPPPHEYYSSGAKLNLDGIDLLNISGGYLEPDAVYTTEINNTGLRIESLGVDQGFMVTDNSGRKTEYGTTLDSRIVTNDQNLATEWRIKQQTDHHGNTVYYEYISSPQGPATKDANTSYLRYIYYGGNIVTKEDATRIVVFDYKTRDDIVAHTSVGAVVTWANLLVSISIGGKINGKFVMHRSYELTYGRSETTGDSRLERVMEHSVGTGDTVNILPTSFEYTSQTTERSKQFFPGPTVDFADARDVISILPLNISGKALTDLACMEWAVDTKILTVKTYIAERNTDGAVAWSPSESNIELSLPCLEKPEAGWEMPSFMTPDLHCHGRSDLIIPFQNEYGNLTFYLARSNGTGLVRAEQTKETTISWVPQSKFMAMDMTGTGIVDVVQIYPNINKLCFRNFPGIMDESGHVGLKDAIETSTEFDFENTMDWFLLKHSGTGAVSLVRVWKCFTPGSPDVYDIKTTSFRCMKSGDSSNGFEAKGIESFVSYTVRRQDPNAPQWTVLSCDINGDGTQDMVLGKAEHLEKELEMTFYVSLGDGLGGFRAPKEITIKAPIPANAAGGIFSVTNLNGGLYPSLAYVFRLKDNNSFWCVSVDGTCDGGLSAAASYRVISDSGSEKTQFIPTDLGGTGMGGWIFYNLDNSTRKVIPVYNKGNPTDLLSSASDSMGLTTNIDYKCLTDPLVYDSGVDWKGYTVTNSRNFVIQGAPNYVVSELQHINNPSINSLKYEVRLKKTYRGAMTNSQGRGWLGFASITTKNINDGILTIEHYFQTFPKVGMKSQIDTCDLDAIPLLSQTTDYKSVLEPQKENCPAENKWNVWHINKSFDKVVTGGGNGRTQLTSFTYDNNGNVVTKYSAEQHQSSIKFQSWEHCTYTTIGDITNLLTGKKVTGKDGNDDLSKFEPGDIALSIYTYGKNALLKTERSWSDDRREFLTTVYQFDAYGNEVSTFNPAKLKTTTVYDNVYHNLAVQRMEEGNGVRTIEYTAYDIASGQVVAKRETNGRLICNKLDEFGRVIETFMRSTNSSSRSVSAESFFRQTSYVASKNFGELTSSDCILDPSQDYGYYHRTTGQENEKWYVVSTTTSYFHDYDNSGRHVRDVSDVFDCVGQRRIQRCIQGFSASPESCTTCKYLTYDSRGNIVFESFPLQPAPGSEFDYQPLPTEGTISAFDKLGRVLTKTRPSHEDPLVNITLELDYSIGGEKITERVRGPDPNHNSTQTTLLVGSRSFISINGKDHVIQATYEPGLVSNFTYNAAGNIISSRDPNGGLETRKYNSLGQLLIFDNGYQRIDGSSTPSPLPTMTYEYDSAGQLQKTTNANNEIITFVRDSKGRPLSKVGSDGRQLQYRYDESGVEGLSSMTIFPKNSGNSLESKISFKYDKRAQIQSRTLTLDNGEQYVTTFEYDWQGQTTTKSYPNGAIKRNVFKGSLLLSSEIFHEAGGKHETWLEGKFEYDDATAKPTSITFGDAAREDFFVHHFGYDLQAYPTSHALLRKGPTLTTLTQERYIYNGADQLAQRIDDVKEMTIMYDYDGKRLKSSKGGGVINTYAYDSAGNLMMKGDTSITYSGNRAQGTRNGSRAFDIWYDPAGRTIRRSTVESELQFHYDSFGQLESYTDDAQKKTTIICGPDGKTVRRDERGNKRSLILVSDDYNVQKNADGSTITTLKLFGAGILLGSCSLLDTSKGDKPSVSGTQAVSSAVFTDNKGNVTHRFRVSDASLLETITYDDFGKPTLSKTTGDDRSSDDTSTFESKRLDQGSGLLDFGARWYDPLIGRFSSPDDILSVELLVRNDGQNRMAFENNDPINHTDPSGHWSLSAKLGAIFGAVMVAAAAAITFMTGGAAAPLAAAAAGALSSGGVAGILYSINHRNERGGKFWGGYASTVLVNAAIGAATGALGAVATPANMASATGRLGQAVGWTTNTATKNLIGNAATLGSKTLIGATQSLLTTVAHNAVEKTFYGAHYSLFEGAGSDFLIGGLVAGLGAGVGHFMGSGRTGVTDSDRLKAGLKGGLFVVGRAALKVITNEHVSQKAKDWARAEAREKLHHEQGRFQSLTSLVGPSGLVGVLHNELSHYQSYVNYG